MLNYAVIFFDPLQFMSWNEMIEIFFVSLVQNKGKKIEPLALECSKVLYGIRKCSLLQPYLFENHI